MAVATVACKLPHGLILRITDMVKVMQSVFAGAYREIEEDHLRTTSVRPNGYAPPHGMMPRDPQGNPVMVFGGNALTPNVDAEFFQAWMQQHHDHPLVKKRLIFAHARDQDVTAKAREMADSKCRLEPRDPKNLPRQFRHDPSRAGISGITQATPGAS